MHVNDLNTFMHTIVVQRQITATELTDEERKEQYRTKE